MLELTLFLLAASFAAVPFTTLVSRTRTRILVVMAALVSAASMAWVAASVRTPRALESEIESRPIAVPANGFVTSNACHACHPAEHATWSTSYHSKMTQRVAPDTVLGDFADVELELGDRRYRLERRDDRFWVEMDDTQAPDGKARHELVMSTGSHHMQVYWYGTGSGRELGQLPFLWLTHDQRWVPRYAAFLRPVPAVLDEKGRWNYTCNKCHATHARPGVVAPQAIDTEVSEFGIACEACHGPGEHHVRVNRNPVRRYELYQGDGADFSIINPTRLDHVRASYVCAQCHAMFQFNAPSEYQAWKTEGYRYRPGDDLTATRFFIHKGQQHPALLQQLRDDPSFMDRKFWPDGALRTAGREFIGLLATPCFERGEMSCLSCHAMHQPSEDSRPPLEWADDQLKPGMRGNLACTQCHTSFEAAAALASHTHHSPDSSGSNCYNCHMPYTAYGLLKAIRAHQMDSPSVAASLATGRPNGCNQCHLDRTLAWTAEHLESWYGQAQPALDDDERTLAAAVLWIIRGDATQRALMAWSMGWSDARQVSGDGWMAPYLGQLLADPYDAVRYIAQRSLKTLPGFAAFEYDYVAPHHQLVAAGWSVITQWEQQARAARSAGRDPSRAALAIDARGQLRKDILQRLIMERDNRVIELDE